MADDKYKKILEQIEAEKQAKIEAEAPKSEMEYYKRKADEEAKYADSEGRTFGERAAGALSFGLSDQFLVKQGLATPEDLRKREEYNPASALAGEVTGTLAPMLATGGTSAAAKVATKAGAAVVGAQKAGQLVGEAALKKLLKDKAYRETTKKILQKTVPEAVGSSVEGAFYGAGQLIKEDALGIKELNAENLAASVGTGMLIGGSIGSAAGVFGGIGATVPIISKKASETANKVLKKTSDLTENTMDLMGVTPAAKVKLRKQHKEIDTHAKEVVTALKDNNALKILQSTSDLGEGYAKVVDDTLTKLDNVYDSLAGEGIAISKNNFYKKAEAEINKLTDKYKELPGYGQDIENLKRGLLKDLGVLKGDVIPEAFENTLNKNLDNIIDKLESGKISLESPEIKTKLFEKLTKTANTKESKLLLRDLKNNFNMTIKEVNTGLLDDAGSKVMNYVRIKEIIKGKLDDIKTVNVPNVKMNAKELRYIKTKIDDKLNSFYKSTDPNMTLSQEAMFSMRRLLKKEIDVIASKSSNEKIKKELASLNSRYNSLKIFEPYIEKKASKDVLLEGIGLLDYGVMGALSALGAPGIGTAIVGTKTILKSDLKRRVVILNHIEQANKKNATKMDSALKNFFKKDFKNKPFTATSTRALINSAIARQDGKKPKDKKQALQNIKRNVEDLNGNPEKLLNTITRNTMALSYAAPEAAQQSAMIMQKQVQFLASKLPTFKSKQGVLQTLTKDKNWQPSTMEMAKFERYVEALDNPMSVMDDLESGTLSREKVEVLREVYPTIYQQVQSKAMDFITKDPEALSYKKRIQLGTLLNIPADSSLLPENIGALQRNFTKEQEQKDAKAIDEMGRYEALDMAADEMSQVERVSKK